VTVGLLERCRAGDEAAWRELFARWAGPVYRWSVLLGLSASDAEDAAQEVLATAARRIARCEDERALGSWLFQIARRVVANHRRRAWVRRWVGGDDPLDHAAFTVDPATELAARRCLARLPREQAEVLVMHEVAGLTREECARVLGIPAGTVGSRLRRAMAAFRALWDEVGPPARRPLEETP
jgi:RNA polymerase sigma-70 factor (ECF subfamily)